MCDEYSIGEIIILDKDVEVTNLIGDTKTIRKGSKAIVTAAGNLRYFSGNAVSPLDYDIELDRYDAGVLRNILSIKSLVFCQSQKCWTRKDLQRLLS